MKRISKIFALILCSFALASCNNTKPTEDTFTITDMAGREVQIVKNPTKFVCTGPGALRQFTYVGDPTKLVGIEHTDVKGTPGTKPYLSKIKNRDKLPIIGEGGSADQTNMEALIQAKPDVVFTSYISNPKKLDELSQKFGLTFVAVGYNSNGLFAHDIYDSLKMMSKIMGNSERGVEVVDYFEDSRKELAKKAEVATKENGYLGCVNFRGSHGIDHTTGEFPAFDVLNIHNVAHDLNVEKFMQIDKEVLPKMKIDKVIIDAGGFKILKDDMAKYPDYYNEFPAFKNDEVYMIMPTVFYSCNFDVALANAYYVGSIFYPEQFKDLNIVNKFNEISNFLYGEDCYHYVSEYFHANYGKLSANLK